MKLQYNPSTGKLSYNPITGLIQIVKRTVDNLCCKCWGIDETPLQVKVTFSGITGCLGEDFNKVFTLDKFLSSDCSCDFDTDDGCCYIYDESDAFVEFKAPDADIAAANYVVTYIDKSGVRSVTAFRNETSDINRGQVSMCNEVLSGPIDNQFTLPCPSPPGSKSYGGTATVEAI